MAIATTSVPVCPMCGQPGAVRYADLVDRLFGVPGVWTFRACTGCDTLWLDPRPASECLALIYPTSYGTHRGPADVLADVTGWVFRPRTIALFDLLHRVYGYPLPPLPPAGPVMRWLGAAVAATPGYEREHGDFVRFLPARRGGRLLDVGCGNGSFLLTMSRLGWTVQGIEPDPAAAALARCAGLPVDQTTIESATLEPHSYDAITLSHVLEHLDDPHQAIQWLGGALRPGGWLVSISPNPLSLLRCFFGEAWSGLDRPRHFVLPGPQALAALAQRAGLQPRVWTMTGWVSKFALRDTIGLKVFGGDWRAYQGRKLPHLLVWLLRVATLLKWDVGNEAVLVARKP